MGQSITVVRKPTTTEGRVRYELDRSLTGMGHESYSAGDEVEGDRCVDELARRLLAHEGVERVHVYSNMVTLSLQEFASEEGLEQTISDVMLYYNG